jgi:hypothetical protein
VEREGDENRNLPDVHRWQLELVSAMRAAVENPSRTDTIGGSIQCVVVGAGGVFEQTWSYTRADSMEPGSWTDATVSLKEVQQHKPTDPRRHVPQAAVLRMVLK